LPAQLANSLKTVRVTRKGADRVLSGHPWIFSSDVSDRSDAERGEAVRVADPKGRTLGTAHYSSTSQITLRMLSRKAEPIDREWFHRRIEAALAYRTRFVRDTDAYRLVYSEADGLPGLIVDRYGDYLVIQTLSQGMDGAKAAILDVLTSLIHPAGVVARNDVPVRAKEDLPIESRVIVGDVPGAIQFRMNGLAWQADLLHGQKTGVFLDQRENYRAAASFASGRALDCFTFAGGFALHLARACEHVIAIDSSAEAVAAGRANAERNGLTNVEFRQEDVFDALTRYSRSSDLQQFDTVVLDPPAFTKTRTAVEGAARGYKDINQRAMRLLRPGGILVTCSCSHHFSEAMLLETVASAGLDAGRIIRVIERRTQALDHPILLTVPETHYLKCLILQVF
jgi:23S rRNA (cytosine1962-C5)-methyltransferase